MKLLFSILILLCASAASASSHPPITLTEIIEQSAAVVRVAVLEVDEAGYDFDAAEPFTDVHVEVLETLVGTVDSTLTLVFRGGLLPDGSRRVWDIVPALQVGQVYVLFLRANEYFVTPLVSPLVLREVVVQGEHVLVDPEGRLVELDLEYPRTGPVVADSADTATDESRPERRKSRPHLPPKAQTQAKALDVIRTAGRMRRNKSRAASVLPARPSSLEPMKDLMP